MSRIFHTDNDWSHQQSKAHYWEEVYRQAFPTLTTCEEVPDGRNELQLAGIDRLLTLSNGQVYNVDEKARRDAYPDIALEIFHEYPSGRRKPGWARKDSSLTHFIAYAKVPTETCYLLPFRALRVALDRCIPTWWKLAERKVSGFRLADSQPGDQPYLTRCLCVPDEIFLDAIRETMIIRWTAQPVDNLQRAAPAAGH